MHRSTAQTFNVACLLLVFCGSALAQTSGEKVAQSDRFPDIAEIKTLVGKCETHTSLVRMLQPDLTKWAELMEKNKREWLAPALDYLVELAAARPRETMPLAAFRIRLAAGMYA